MVYCKLCESEYIGVILGGWFCETCRKIKSIMRVYGAEETKIILEDICLRDKEKRQNKINKAVSNASYSPACKKEYNLRNKPIEEVKKTDEIKKI